MKSRPVDNFGMPPRLIGESEMQLEDGNLDKGTFGRVVRALMKDKLRPSDPDSYVVVVKVSLLPDLAAQMAEYDALKQVEPHPNLCSLVGYMVHDGTLRFVLPFIGGGSLEVVVKRDPQFFLSSLSRIVQATLDILRGLEALDKKGLVHRDRTCDAVVFVCLCNRFVFYSTHRVLCFCSGAGSLFPVAARNVMITVDGVCVIIDFGMAKAMRKGKAGGQREAYYRQSNDVPQPVRWYVLVLVAASVCIIYGCVCSCSCRCNCCCCFWCCCCCCYCSGSRVVC